MRGNKLIVAEKASKLDVDHRLRLRIYYRAADSLLRQAGIYRKENNLIDLYVLLLRFTSLVLETIPQHRDYLTFSGREKQDFVKRSLDALNELETLKPKVQFEVSQYNNASLSHHSPSNGQLSAIADTLPPVLAKSQSFSGVATGKGQNYHQLGHSSTGDQGSRPLDVGRRDISAPGNNWTGDFNKKSCDQQGHEDSKSGSNHIDNVSSNVVDVQRRGYSQTGNYRIGDYRIRPVDSGNYSPNYPSKPPIDHSLKTLSLSIPSPTSETLSRHSFLHSNSFGKKTKSSTPPTVGLYPSLIDESPKKIPSLDQSWHTLVPISGNATESTLKPVGELDKLNQADLINLEEKHSGLIESAVSSQSKMIRQPSPPPVPAEIQTVPGALSAHKHEMETCGVASLLKKPLEAPEDSACQRKPKDLHISVVLMEEFMGVAKGNTRNNIETCGVLAGALKAGVFYVTTLIIPKQEATANSCSTINEEELFEYQDKHDLFQFGWIHTHPSQSCFMSSIDLHTQYSYQVMLQEAVAIVMAPTDMSRKYGIFRLSEPSGLKVIQQCDKRGFHPHDQPPDGPIYGQCAHVFLDPKLSCEVVDLR